MDELKPCPFCGKSELHTNREGHVRCVNDECFQNQFIGGHAWQTRPLEDALQQRVDYFQGIMNEYSADLAGLRTSISEAVKEIELEWLNGVAGTDGNRDDVYQSGAGKALDILRKHGLIGGGE